MIELSFMMGSLGEPALRILVDRIKLDEVEQFVKLITYHQIDEVLGLAGHTIYVNGVGLGGIPFVRMHALDHPYVVYAPVSGLVLKPGDNVFEAARKRLENTFQCNKQIGVTSFIGKDVCELTNSCCLETSFHLKRDDGVCHHMFELVSASTNSVEAIECGLRIMQEVFHEDASRVLATVKNLNPIPGA